MTVKIFVPRPLRHVLQATHSVSLFRIIKISVCSSKTIKLVASTDKYLLYLILKVSSQRTPLKAIYWLEIFDMWFKMKRSKLEGLRVCCALAGWCGAKLKWHILCISQCRCGSLFWHCWSHCKHPSEITAAWWGNLLILMVLSHPNRYLFLSQSKYQDLIVDIEANEN